jgi:hypothetical protein
VDVSRYSQRCICVFIITPLNLCGAVVDKIDLPKQARVQVELRCHFDETNEFGGVLLADAVISVSSLTHFSTDIEMDMKDISAALNVSNAEYGKASGSVQDIERSYILQQQQQLAASGQQGSSSSGAGNQLASPNASGSALNTGEAGSKAGAKCSVTLRLKYQTPEQTTALTTTDSQSAAASTSTDSSSSSSHPHETSRVHKVSVGKLFVTLWQGKSLSTSCPVYVTMFLATLRAKGCRTPSKPNPHNPVFDYMCEVDIYSLQADLVVEVWEEQMAGNNKLGQIIIPVSWLLHTASVATLTGYKKSPKIAGDIDSLKNEMSISSWFEVFPPATPTPFNRGGQYRPYYKGE